MLEELGCFSIVLECIPGELAEAITTRIGIPTIGIGAGAACDGQVLVWHDMLGLSQGYLPKHARRFAELKPTIQNALEEYVKSVREGTFPGPMESFKGEDGLLDDL
jgi:3-methyl-2-oxobutanoate hydroxymethyltransferase